MQPLQQLAPKVNIILLCVFANKDVLEMVNTISEIICGQIPSYMNIILKTYFSKTLNNYE